MNVLFLCTGNSCRSILGEGTFNHLVPEGWAAMSAGSKPAGYVHPRSLALLAREGISTEGYYSKSWDALPATPDIVITVCGSAAGETCDKAAGEVCPHWPGQPMTAHWGFLDPASVQGSDDEMRHAFAVVCREIKTRLDIFMSLPLQKLEKLALKRELDKIGEMKQ